MFLLLECSAVRLCSYVCQHRSTRLYSEHALPPVHCGKPRGAGLKDHCTLQAAGKVKGAVLLLAHII